MFLMNLALSPIRNQIVTTTNEEKHQYREDATKRFAYRKHSQEGTEKRSTYHITIEILTLHHVDRMKMLKESTLNWKKSWPNWEECGRKWTNRHNPL